MVPRLVYLRWMLAAGALSGSACATERDTSVGAGPVAGHMTFDEYVASLPFDEETGAFVVEGDILAYDRSELTDYYAAHLYGTALTLDQTGSGIDSKYSAADARSLTYCVSDSFGSDKAAVRDTFGAAALEWMEATKIAPSDAPTVRFTYDPDHDDDCTADNADVHFNIAPSTSTKFDAASFFPHWTRSKREVLITKRAMKPFKARTFAGVMRHEIGHILGFRHEHIEGDTPCPEKDHTWRSLSEHDVPSVMHYRDVAAGSCWNSGITDYTLTTLDNAGVRCIYTTQARASADTAGDACRALTSYSTPASSFVIDGYGQLYRLTHATTSSQRTSVVARYVPPTPTSKQRWTTLWSANESLASPASTIYAGGSELYRRTSTHLYRWRGSSWEAIDGGAGSAVTVASVTGDLFRLNSDGTIDRVVAGSRAATRILASGAQGRKLFPGTAELYRVESNGDAYLWARGTWAGRIGTGIRAVAETEAGSTFCLLNDAAGTVMLRKSSGVWSTIGSNARALWGGLEVPYISLKDNPATAANESTVIRRNTSGSTWHRYALSSTRIMKGADRRIAINTNGRPYAYVTP
jgi:serralysin